MDITLFELHLPDAEFNAPFAGRTSPAPEEAPTDDAASEGDGARFAPLLALVALAGLALLARYLRGTGADQTTLDELEA